MEVGPIEPASYTEGILLFILIAWEIFCIYSYGVNGGNFQVLKVKIFFVFCGYP